MPIEHSTLVLSLELLGLAAAVGLGWVVLHGAPSRKSKVPEAPAYDMRRDGQRFQRIEQAE